METEITKENFNVGSLEQSPFAKNIKPGRFAKTKQQTFHPYKSCSK
jgi:hypothetical protein